MTFNAPATNFVHGLAQGVIAEARGGSFRSGFVGAFMGHLAPNLGIEGSSFGAVFGRTATAAIWGGLVTEATGGSFEDGAFHAAVVHLFNNELDDPEFFDTKEVEELRFEDDQLDGSIEDLLDNYTDMREANTKGADKYFHCKANCQAAKRGPLGANVAEKVSNFREWWDQNIKSYPASDSILDQQANYYGRNQGALGVNSCSSACSTYRPNALDSKY